MGATGAGLHDVPGLKTRRAQRRRQFGGAPITEVAGSADFGVRPFLALARLQAEGETSARFQRAARLRQSRRAFGSVEMQQHRIGENQLIISVKLILQ
jgi:hypothetical protein